MFKNMSVQIKLFIFVAIVVVISFVAVALLVSDRSIEMAKEDAFTLAREMAEKYKNEIMAELQGARVTSETLKAVLETLKDHDITDRDMINDMLRKALEQKEYITAFCVAYDPNMLDGRDAEYAGQAPYDETGRFAPYWNKLGSNIDAEPLLDIDAQDWYIVPKGNKKEYITNPYPFHVQGQDVMLASFIFPLIHDGEFIGIIASDIVLDKLQEMVSQVDTRGMGEYTAVFSNSGAVVAHPDKQYLGKTIGELLLYDMLISHPDKIGPAVRSANTYIQNHPLPGSPDEAQMRKHENTVQFVAGLLAYSSGQNRAKPDLSLLTPVLAGEMLETDPDRLEYVREVSSAIGNGELYISSNNDYYTVYMPIRFSEDTNPWSVAVSIPMPEVLKVSNNIRNYVIIVCAISVCVIAFIIYLISKSITRPILTLAGAAKQLGEGNLNVEVPLVQNNKEIGILSNAFRVMVERIDGLIRKLQNNAKELEEKNVHLNNLNEMLIATNHVAETILNVEYQQFQDVLHQSLRILGKSAGAEGVSIWQNFTYPDGKTYGRRLSAWITGQSNQYMNAESVIDPDELLPGWRQQGKIKGNGGSTVLDGSAFLHRTDSLLHAGSLFFIPLVLHDSGWGFIAFSYKAEQYDLPRDVSEILRSGGMMIASAIIQNQISEDLEEAEAMAATDSLTGLTNRNGFLFRASSIYTTSKEKHSPLSLLFFDLDHFKRINDQYGHPFGDEVLKAFAAVVKQETRLDDVCCRYGGEEFILLCNNCDASGDRQLRTGYWKLSGISVFRISLSLVLPSALV
ncbi:diguanylate cyclase [Brucepastera parasyntrophica]|uniref:diguanylate cyclase n=1 Tax=Brucepastera parasyntrophica TaxID=2880008 RepID=UPI00210C3446|nr:diguanylate cyclase [Brucepastera parasyntrophica]